MGLIDKMKLWTKNYFIPHEGNDHKPHALRVKSVIILLVIALFTELTFMAHVSVMTRTGYLAEIISSVLVEQTNEERVTLGIQELSVNPILEQAARLKANDMALKSYFAHTSPEGVSPWAWLEAVGYTFTTAGENLAVNFVDSEDVTEAWMNSPGHRANIVHSDFTEIGIATAKGKYKGDDAIFIVQFFGKPLVQQASAQVAPSTPPTTQTPTPAPETIKEQTETTIVLEEAVTGIPIEEPVITSETNAGSTPDVSPIERAASNPRSTYDLLLLIIGTIVALALAFTIFMRKEVFHPPLVVNGVLLLLVVASALALNHYLTLSEVLIV